MAFPVKYFKGKIDGKEVKDFMDRLDFSLGQKDRIKLVNDILYPDGYLDSYFQKYFDGKFKVKPSKDDYLSTDNNVCHTLEKMANYILFADDAEKVRKLKYNFYTMKKLQERFGKEISLDEMVEKTYKEIESKAEDKKGTPEPNMTFVMKKVNYKLEVEQNIDFKDVCEIQPIQDYEMLKAGINNRLKALRLENKNKIKQRRYVALLKGLKGDQILCKDQLRATIYFKAPLRDSQVVDYDQFDNYDSSQIIPLLSCSGSLSTDVGCLKYDLIKLIERLDKKGKINKDYLQIIKLLDSGLSISDIAYKFDQQYNNIFSKVRSLSKLLIKEYERSLDDWYYTFVIRARFKKCRRCGKNKVSNLLYYGHDKRNKDGFKFICRDCRASNAKY